MSTTLRIELIGVALLMFLLVVRTINRKKLQVRYSFIWLVVSVALIAAALFPELTVFLCRITGIQTPSNLIYLVGILFLMMICFYLCIIVTRQDEQIKTLTQLLSLHQYEEQCRRTNTEPVSPTCDLQKAKEGTPHENSEKG